MDSSLEFAQRLLDQLRRDLKRLDPECLNGLHESLGRSTRYIERARASSLRLKDAVVAIRFLGFKPYEYIERLSGRAFLIPPSIPGFLAFRKPVGMDFCGLKELASFVEWGRTVIVDPRSTSSEIDIEKHLKTFGIRPDWSDFLRAADFVFSTFSAHEPETIHPITAKTLVGDLCVISTILMDQGYLSAACDLLDVGFHLDQFRSDWPS